MFDLCRNSGSILLIYKIDDLHVLKPLQSENKTNHFLTLIVLK